MASVQGETPNIWASEPDCVSAKDEGAVDSSERFTVGVVVEMLPVS